jgi:hypothetical protein
MYNAVIEYFETKSVAITECRLVLSLSEIKSLANHVGLINVFPPARLSFSMKLLSSTDSTRPKVLQIQTALRT